LGGGKKERSENKGVCAYKTSPICRAGRTLENIFANKGGSQSEGGSVHVGRVNFLLLADARVSNDQGRPIREGTGVDGGEAVTGWSLPPSMFHGERRREIA